ncbi:NUDIX domain-containing protein [Pseudaestuariivita sp.]|uniref:NUDIX domain-containing protein n=1 Tax=Pseudaestuariivita sp. TaxID=2211669 RepID=UPI00405A3F12
MEVTADWDRVSRLLECFADIAPHAEDNAFPILGSESSSLIGNPKVLAMFEEMLPEVLYWSKREAPSAVRKRLRTAQMRAWSRVLARRDLLRDLAEAPRDVALTNEGYGHGGFFALKTCDVAHARFDGREMAPTRREVFTAFDAALVLPYDPVQDCVLLVEQFRIAPHLRGSRTAWVLEPIAGLVDAGEEPEEAARREAEEEAGLALKSLELIARGYPSPGASTEFYHMFLGLADLPESAEGLGGLDAEGEDIRAHRMTFDAFLEMVDINRLSAMPLAMMGHWLARHRPRLRQAAGAA